MRIAVLSDIHANVFALDKVFDHAFNHERCEHLFFLGDLLGYGAKPVETINSFMRYLDVSSIIGGNHESLVLRLLTYFSDISAPLYTAENITKFKQLYPGISTFAIGSCLSNLDEVLLHKDEPGASWYLEMINHNEASFAPMIKNVDRPIQLAHGTHADREICYLFGWQNPFIANDLHIKPLLTKKQPSLISFTGHTHIPMIYKVKSDWQFREPVTITYGNPIHLGEDLCVINPGAVGFPRDGDTRASYAVLDTEAWTITFHRLDYDDTSAKEAMRIAGFDMKYIKSFMMATFPGELTKGTAEGWIDPKYQQELVERHK